MINISKVRNEIAAKVSTKADFDKLTETEKAAYAEYLVHVCAVKYETGYVKETDGGAVLMTSDYLLRIAEDIRKHAEDYTASVYLAIETAAEDADFFNLYKAVSRAVQQWYRDEHGTPHEQKHRYVQTADIDFGSHCPSIAFTETGIVLADCLPSDERKRAYILHRINGDTAAEAVTFTGLPRRTGERALADFRFDARAALGGSYEAEAIAIYWTEAAEA